MIMKMRKKDALDQSIFEERKVDPLFFRYETDKIIMGISKFSGRSDPC